MNQSWATSQWHSLCPRPDRFDAINNNKNCWLYEANKPQIMDLAATSAYNTAPFLSLWLWMLLWHSIQRVLWKAVKSVDNRGYSNERIPVFHAHKKDDALCDRLRGKSDIAATSTALHPIPLLSPSVSTTTSILILIIQERLMETYTEGEKEKERTTSAINHHLGAGLLLVGLTEIRFWVRRPISVCGFWWKEMTMVDIRRRQRSNGGSSSGGTPCLRTLPWAGMRADTRIQLLLCTVPSFKSVSTESVENQQPDLVCSCGDFDARWLSFQIASTLSCWFEYEGVVSWYHHHLHECRVRLAIPSNHPNSELISARNWIHFISERLHSASLHSICRVFAKKFPFDFDWQLSLFVIDTIATSIFQTEQWTSSAGRIRFNGCTSGKTIIRPQTPRSIISLILLVIPHQLPWIQSPKSQ